MHFGLAKHWMVIKMPREIIFEFIQFNTVNIDTWQRKVHLLHNFSFYPDLNIFVLRK
jgi:hypothetical protein